MLWWICWVCVFKHARHQLKKKKHECVLGERGVFDLFWVLFFDKKCVRVTSEREVGYEVVTEGSIGG